MSNYSSLTVALPEALDAFVRQRVASGRFASASDVVQDVLILLERREHDRDAALDEIGREIQLGIEQAEAGQLRDGKRYSPRSGRSSAYLSQSDSPIVMEMVNPEWQTRLSAPRYASPRSRATCCRS